MYLHQSLRDRLRTINIDFFSDSDDIVYIIDAEYTLLAYNDSWRDFAIDNESEYILDLFPLGCNLLDAFSEDLQEFYGFLYADALRSGTRVEHDYECSSDKTYRLFHQVAYPVVEKDMLIITNHQICEHDHRDVPHLFGQVYRNAKGLIVQCSHCRKLRNMTHPNKWDWVPSAVKRTYPDTTHSLCPVCTLVYYKRYLTKGRAG